jgi:hypothetical protein
MQVSRGHFHASVRPSCRRIIAAAQAVRPRASACPGDVRERRRSAADPWRRASSAERSDRDVDQRRSVRLRHCNAHPDDRFWARRHPTADHYGRDGSGDLADAGDGGDAWRRADRHLWRGAGRRTVWDLRGAFRQICAAVLPRGGDGDDHHDDRNRADARRRRLGRRRRGGVRFRRRGLPLSRRVSAWRNPADHQIRQRFSPERASRTNRFCASRCRCNSGSRNSI